MFPPRLAFIKKIAADVIKSCKGTGLFPSVMLAQACLESSNGLSALSTDHNNYFGIKAPPAWSGTSVAEYPTNEYIRGTEIKVMARFRSYPTIVDGFNGRIEFLQKNERYTQKGVFSAASPEAQVRALCNAGYATDPKYYSLVTDIVKEYDLAQYDKEAA